MNYQFPLLNLITRGHLPVKNPIASKKFVERLDNDSCQTILENLMSINDSKICAKKLDEVMESYQFKTGTRMYVSEATLGQCRDEILANDSPERRQSLCEATMDDVLGTFNAKEQVEKLITMIKLGGVTAAIYKLAAMKPTERANLLDNMKNMSRGTYEFLRTQPLFGRILPQTDTLGRTASGIWKFDLKNSLKPDDRKWYSEHYGKPLKMLGIGALIAVGMTAAIVGISMAYKRWFSAAAKVCKGLSGKKRTICMCNAIIAASEKALAKSEKGLLECDSAKDPDECRYKMKIEIRSWKKKIEEQKRKLLKLGKVSNRPYGNSSDTTDVKVSQNPFE